MLQKKPDSFAFLVLGMHRSGTSALTRVLNFCGLDTSQNLLPANRYNKSGYWEPKNIVHFNDNLLKSLDRHWADPKPLPLGWENEAKLLPLINEATNLLQSEFDHVDGTVIKDPRMSRVMPVWHRAVEKSGSQPVCLISYRNPLDVYRSLHARDGMDIEHAMHLWLSYMLEAEAGSRGLRRAFVSFDALLTDWNATVSSAFSAAKMPNLLEFDKHKSKVDLFIDKDQRNHNAMDTELPHHNEVRQIVKDVYELCKEADNPENLAQFEQLHGQWLAEWKDESPGTKGTEFVRRLPSWHQEQSVQLKKSGRTKDALSAIRTAIELNPQLAKSYHLLGNLDASNGELKEAEAAQRQAISLQNNEPTFHVALSGVLNRLGRSEEAIQAIEQAIKLNPSQARYHHKLGNFLTATGKLQEAETAHRQATSLQKNEPNFHVALSGVLYRLARPEEAIQAIKQALKLKPSLANLHHKLGNMLVATGKLREAEIELRQAISLKNDEPNFYISLTRVLKQLGKPEAAIEMLSQAIGLSPKRAKAHHLMGNLLTVTGRLEEAESAHRRAISLKSDEPDFYIALSRILKQQGKTDAAIKMLQQTVINNPWRAQSHHLLGNLLAATGRWQEAEAAHLQAVELKSDDPLYHLSFSRVLNQLGLTKKAALAARRAVRLDPNDIQLRHFFGSLLFELGRNNEAKNEFYHVAQLGCQKFDVRCSGEQTNLVSSKLTDQVNMPELISVLAVHASSWWTEALKFSATQSETAQQQGRAVWPLGRLIPLCEAPHVKRQKRSKPSPLLSIMIPVYNVKRENWLRQCIESVLAQDKGAEWAEIIIVDDASSNIVAQSVADRYSERVTYRRNETNLGIVANHNRCLDISTGEFVHILHQDDRVEAGFYDTLLDALTRDDELVAGFTSAVIVDGDGNRVRDAKFEKAQAGIYENFLPKLIQRQHVSFPAMLVRRSAYESVGGFSPSLCFAFDWEMWGRLGASGEIWYVPSRLVSFRVHDESTTNSIAAIDRLLDCFHCIASLLPYLPTAIRWETGWKAIYNQVVSAWGKARNSKLSSQQRNDLVEFLLRDWSTSDEKDKTRTALSRREP